MQLRFRLPLWRKHFTVHRKERRNEIELHQYASHLRNRQNVLINDDRNNPKLVMIVLEKWANQFFLINITKSKYTSFFYFTYHFSYISVEVFSAELELHLVFFSVVVIKVPLIACRSRTIHQDMVFCAYPIEIFHQQ
jgi:hypothetical protein